MHGSTKLNAIAALQSRYTLRYIPLEECPLRNRSETFYGAEPVVDHLLARNDAVLERLKAFHRLPSVSTNPAYAKGLGEARQFLLYWLKQIGLSNVQLLEPSAAAGQARSSMRACSPRGQGCAVVGAGRAAGRDADAGLERAVPERTGSCASRFISPEGRAVLQATIGPERIGAALELQARLAAEMALEGLAIVADGVLGLGHIGSGIARRAEAMGMHPRYCARRKVAGCAYTYHPNAEALASDSDVFIVACPGGAQNRGLVDAAVLAALGPEGTLVNIARGEIIEEDALVEALATGKLESAGLDVFAHEPHVPARLLDLQNVILTPHIGSATIETRNAMGECVV